VCFLFDPGRDVIIRTVSWESTVGATSQLWDIRQPVRSLAEDIVRIRYQETTNEDMKDCMCTAVTMSEL
jgi:hypothetical protein